MFHSKTAWEIEDEYMFGPDILVAPVMEENTSERKVYLPEGAIWTDKVKISILYAYSSM